MGPTRLALYPALGIPDNAPAILRPILGFLAAWAMLRKRGERWASLGLARPTNWIVAIGGAVALYLVNMALSQWAVPAIADVFKPQPQVSFLDYVRGNVGGFVLWAAIGWIVGGFIEECLFRGFLLTRVSQLFANGIFYVLLGRNLWPLIVVHGVWNTVGIWSTYAS